MNPGWRLKVLQLRDSNATWDASHPNRFGHSLAIVDVAVHVAVKTHLIVARKNGWVSRCFDDAHENLIARLDVLSSPVSLYHRLFSTSDFAVAYKGSMESG